MFEPVTFISGADEASDQRLFVQLRRLSGLIGGNDVGKSRLLRQLLATCRTVDAAAGRPTKAPEALFAPEEPRMLVCRATEADLRRLLDVSPNEDLAALIAATASSSTIESRVEPDSRRQKEFEVVAHHALQDPYIVAPAQPGGARGLPLLLASPLSEVSEHARAALAAVGISRPSDWPPDVPVPWLGLREWLSHDYLLPTAISLPAREDEVLEVVQRATGALLSAFTVVEDAIHNGALAALEVRSTVDPGALPFWNEMFLALVQDPWLHPQMEHFNGSEQPNPWLTGAVGVISAISDHLLPDFIRRTYAIGVFKSTLSSWISGAPRAWPGLRRRGDQGRPFNSSDIAEGYRIWVQVTLLDAARITEQIAAWISEVFSREAREAHGIQGLDPWLEDVAPVVPVLLALREQRGPVFLGAVQELIEHVHPYAGAAPDLEQIGAERHTVYIFDEPERHLHPALQREAAAWMASRVQSEATSVVFATHAVAFMALSDNASYVYAFRDDEGRPAVTPIDPSALTSADLVAEQLGLDRGELLAFLRHLVFVEGETDRLFMEGLYGPELDRAGIVLVPLGGATRSMSVLPMAVLLMRYTTAAVSVMLDDIARPEFERLRDDPEACQEAARRAKQVEVRELARLLVAATEQERHIQPLGIPVKDIFDLIDDDVVREVLSDLSRGRFPGHRDARAAVGEGKWKEVYLKRYGIDVLNVETFARAGREMRTRGLRSKVLDDLLGLLPG
jgi:hypothetical protein